LIGGGDGDNDSDTPPNETESLTGTDENDILRGDNTDSDIDGGDGGDLLFGKGGDDTIDGGDGVDFIAGGNGDDVINGGNSGDVLAGGAGDDSLSGGAGNDYLMGGAGDDTQTGDAGNDVLVGSTGSDQLYGGLGDDYLDGVSPSANWPISDPELRAEFTGAINNAHGDAATATDYNIMQRDLESFAGTDGTDALYGGEGSDSFLGNDGDTMTGGAGTDYFQISWEDGQAPVTITDFSGPDESISVYIDDDRTALPDFGIRDAADGSGIDVMVDDDVVAHLANIRLADLGDQRIEMLYQDGTSTAIQQAVRLTA
jgi:Ca2+-binding RTX toxin-like protein